MNLEETENLKKFIQDDFLTGSKNAIECFIFLYSHEEKAYSDREIWEKIKDYIISPGKTPERTFSTEIRKYTDNSLQKLKVSHTKLFTIKNLGETPQKFQLIKEVRNVVYEFLNESKKQLTLHEVIKIISSKGKTHKLGKSVSKEIKGEEFIFHGRGLMLI